MRKAIKAAFFGLISMAFVASAICRYYFRFLGWSLYSQPTKSLHRHLEQRFFRITVENYNGGLGEIKAQVEAGNVTWDVVDVLPDQAITGCDEGLFAKVDQS